MAERAVLRALPRSRVTAVPLSSGSTRSNCSLRASCAVIRTARLVTRAHDRAAERPRRSQRRGADLARPRRGRRCLRRAVRAGTSTPPAGWPASSSAAPTPTTWSPRRSPRCMTVLQSGGGPDVAFRAYLLTAVRRLHVDRIRAQSKLTTTDDLTPFDPGVPFQDTAVARLRDRRRRQGLRLAAGALAAGAVAPRGRGPEARRHRPAARHERQLGLRARLPRPRGTAPGVPADAPRRHLARPTAAGSTSTSAPTSARASPSATTAKVETTSTSAAAAPRCTSSSPRSTPTSPASSRRCCSGRAAAGYLASTTGGVGGLGVFALLSRAKDVAAANSSAVVAGAVSVAVAAAAVATIVVTQRDDQPDVVANPPPG